MANYTIELGTLTKDPNFNIFDFEYDFYTDDLEIKKNFEKKFIQTYYFHEIGQETVARFKYMLKSRLDLEMPYYRKLYETELKTRNIDFMVNKDYTETHSKEIITENIIEGENNRTFNQTSNLNTTNNKSSSANASSEHSSVTDATNNKTINSNNKDVIDSTTTNTGRSDNTYTDNTTVNNNNSHKESFVRDGIANITTDKDLTGATTDTNNESVESNKVDTLLNNNTESNNSTNTQTMSGTEIDNMDSTTTTNDTSKSSSTIIDTIEGTNTLQNSDNLIKNSSERGTNRENYTTTGKGNIGVLSNAKLLAEWRNVIIEIDRQIIDSLYNLFMLIY